MGQRACSVSTFGWARVEVVGALINAVFLYAQCFSIFLQAVRRFLVIEKIQDPKMLLIVGGLGLIINLVGKAVTAITGRLTSLSSFDGTESKVGQLVAAACSTDNLCRMDPAWHPWL